METAFCMCVWMLVRIVSIMAHWHKHFFPGQYWHKLFISMLIYFLLLLSKRILSCLSFGTVLLEYDHSLQIMPWPWIGRHLFLNLIFILRRSVCKLELVERYFSSLIRSFKFDPLKIEKIIIGRLLPFLGTSIGLSRIS